MNIDNASKDDIAELKRQAEQGEAEAQYQLGTIYGSGEIVPKDCERAIKYYTFAAWQGHASAQYVLGRAYLHGEECVEKNYSESYIWLYMATEYHRKEAYKKRAASYRDYVAAKFSKGQGLSPDDLRSAQKEAFKRMEKINKKQAKQD